MTEKTNCSKSFTKYVLYASLIVNALVITWIVSSYIAYSQSDAAMKACEREVEKLESVVSTSALLETQIEWESCRVPIYNIALEEDLQRYTFTKCREMGIENYYELILATMWLESNFKADNISSTDDYGLMQINKVNHEWLSELLGITDFLDPYQSINAGVYIMAALLNKYSDPHKALMAYNYGEGGAALHWENGTYTSSYSRNISEKILLLEILN